jgi:hypothetical protein
MSNFSTGVETVIKRMETNPEEFFNEAHKWHFIFKEKFREVLTEPEKGALHEALKAVRRKEFDYSVVQTLLKDEVQGQMQEYAQGVLAGGTIGGSNPYLTITGSSLNQVQPKESETVKYNAKDRYNFK